MSKSIHTPKLANIDVHSDTSATFTVEPLHTGYGMTLGNSFRRVLLSSIAGAAITSFKIEGAPHEFTTIPGVKEDVVDIMLNLKKINFKVFSDEPQNLRITKKGEGPVTAADIEANAEVEVVNPDQVIATLTNAKDSIVMDIVVDTGRGYHTVEEGSSSSQSGMIAIDSLFSPVTRVRYKVTNTRVGQITDLDKLLLTVDTDGTIDPKDAFEEAAAILINQYTALAGQTRVAVADPIGTEEEVEEDNSELMTPIEDLNLSARTTNALVNNEIHTVKDLLSLGDTELRELKGFGAKALDEVREKIAELEF